MRAEHLVVVSSQHRRLVLSDLIFAPPPPFFLLDKCMLIMLVLRPLFIMAMGLSNSNGVSQRQLG